MPSSRRSHGGCGGGKRGPSPDGRGGPHRDGATVMCVAESRCIGSAKRLSLRRSGVLVLCAEEAKNHRGAAHDPSEGLLPVVFPAPPQLPIPCIEQLNGEPQGLRGPGASGSRLHPRHPRFEPRAKRTASMAPSIDTQPQPELRWRRGRASPKRAQRFRSGASDGRLLRRGQRCTRPIAPSAARKSTSAPPSFRGSRQAAKA
jgi:hypothetical protein